MTDRDTFAALLKQYRLEAGLTQEALAERAFVSSKSIGSLERDQSRLPRLDTVRVLADALELEGSSRERFLSSARPAAPARTERPPSPQRLAVPSMPLYGRDHDLDLIGRMLADAASGSGSRLIVLTGPGGVGKTRLALALAERCAESHPVRSTFVDLSSIPEPKMLVGSIARQLGIADRDPVPVRKRIVSLLRQQQTLILLDNAEHLIAARDDVLSLLDDCPMLVFLVTSRIPFGVRAERQIRLQPLALPSSQSSSAEIVQSPAVNLFIERARAAGWAGDSTRDLPAIAAICRQLDGLPLAIELAAAWTDLFSADELLRRFEQHLPILMRAPHDMPDRHQTMNAAIAWSYDLLDPSLQSSFCRICVFENGAPVSTVCALLAENSDALQCERQLAELADQSLIAWRRNTIAGVLESELHMLQTIREFGLGLLSASDQYEEVARTHAGIMLALAERLESELGGPGESASLELFDQANDNFRVALSRCIAGGDRERALRFVVALWRFWALRGTLAEAISRLDEAIALAGDGVGISAALMTRASTGVAMISMEYGDLEMAARYVDRALSAARSSPADGGLAEALYASGLLAAQRGDNPGAEDLLQHARAQAERESDARTVVAAMAELSGVAFRTGDMARATMLEQECLQRCYQLGDRRGIALSGKNLAFHAMYSGRFEEAQRFASESAGELRELGDTGNLAEVLWLLGHMAYLQGDLDAAAEQLTASRSMRLERGDERNAAKSSGALAVVEIARGNDQQARWLVETAGVPLREQQDRFGLAMNSLVLGHIELAARNQQSARVLLNEGGALLLEMNNLLYLPWFLEGLAVLAVQQEDWKRAARFFLAHDAMTTRSGFPMPPIRPLGFLEARASTLGKLGETAFDQPTDETPLDPIRIAREELKSPGR